MPPRRRRGRPPVEPPRVFQSLPGPDLGRIPGRFQMREWGLAPESGGIPGPPLPRETTSPLGGVVAETFRARVDGELIWTVRWGPNENGEWVFRCTCPGGRFHHKCYHVHIVSQDYHLRPPEYHHLDEAVLASSFGTERVPPHPVIWRCLRSVCLERLRELYRADRDYQIRADEVVRVSGFEAGEEVENLVTLVLRRFRIIPEDGRGWASLDPTVIRRSLESVLMAVWERRIGSHRHALQYFETAAAMGYCLGGRLLAFSEGREGENRLASPGPPADAEVEEAGGSFGQARARKLRPGKK